MINQPLSNWSFHYRIKFKWSQWILIFLISGNINAQTERTSGFLNPQYPGSEKEWQEYFANSTREDGMIPCGTVEHFNTMYGMRSPMMNEAFEQFITRAIRAKGKTNGRIANGLVQIPVIFHIIHDGDPVGTDENLDAALIAAQIQQANEDFRGLAPQGSGGENLYAPTDMQIEFIPAAIDPNGNLLPEPGINRIDATTQAWTSTAPFSQFEMETEVKPATQWDPTLYFNSWSVDLPGGLLGYAQFPDAPDLAGLPMSEPAFTDGIVNDWITHGSRTMQNPGSPSPNYGFGRVFVHEAGHFFGLRHIWGDGDCNFDDFVDDTPTQRFSSSGCPVGQNSCTSGEGPDNYENYMDYSNPLCMDNFTPGQLVRMEAVLGCIDGVKGSPRRAELPFSYVGYPDGFILSTDDTEFTACVTDDILVDFEITYYGSFSEGTPINLSVDGLPPGANAVFSTNPVTANGSYNITISNLTIGSYDLLLKGTDDAMNDPVNRMLPFRANSDGAITDVPVPQTPAHGATMEFQPIMFSWLPVTNATNYLLEVDDNPGFQSIDQSIFTEETSINVSGFLPSTKYHWRVTASSACGNSQASSVFEFTTNAVTPCYEYAAGYDVLLRETFFCSPKGCTEPITSPYVTVWGNEAYSLAVEKGVEYRLEFCTGYDPDTWNAPATITIAEFDVDASNFIGALVSAEMGCEITFTATSTGTYVAIISDICGNNLVPVDNGVITFQCTGNTSPDFPPCPECPYTEDFEAGQPEGWTFNVSGTSGATWSFDAGSIAPFQANYTNPGTGAWAYYDDDALGQESNGDNNIATAISPVFDMTDYVNCRLSFYFNFQAINALGDLTLAASDGMDTYYWNGFEWTLTPVKWLDNDLSGYFDQALPLSFEHSMVQVEIIFDDENVWGWGFGFDDFAVCGTYMPPPPIPTLSQWGLMILTLLFLIIGTISLAGRHDGLTI